VSSLFGVPVDAAYHLVFALTNVLTPVLGGAAAVAGIVVFTAAVRLLVTPLTFRALRGQAAQAALAPQVQRLRQRHARQPERLQRELTELYRREGTSPFAGFAPLLVQWPVFSVLYLLFRSPSVAGGPNMLLSRTLFGAPLGGHWLSGSGAFSAHGAVFIGVFVLLTAACWLVTRAARRALPQPALGTSAPGTSAPGTSAPGTSAPGTSAPGTGAPRTGGAGTALTVVGRIVPYITVLIAAFAPLAGAIYLVTSTSWSAAERLVFSARTDRDAVPDGNAKRAPRQVVRGTAENG
jgi:YidC/Oxa1 family membrane protein insertase